MATKVIANAETPVEFQNPETPVTSSGTHDDAGTDGGALKSMENQETPVTSSGTHDDAGTDGGALESMENPETPVTSSGTHDDAGTDGGALKSMETPETPITSSGTHDDASMDDDIQVVVTVMNSRTPSENYTPCNSPQRSPKRPLSTGGRLWRPYKILKQNTAATRDIPLVDLEDECANDASAEPARDTAPKNRGDFGRQHRPEARVVDRGVQTDLKSQAPSMDYVFSNIYNAHKTLLHKAQVLHLFRQRESMFHAITRQYKRAYEETRDLYLNTRTVVDQLENEYGELLVNVFGARHDRNSM